MGYNRMQNNAGVNASVKPLAMPLVKHHAGTDTKHHAGTDMKHHGGTEVKQGSSILSGLRSNG